MIYRFIVRSQPQPLMTVLDCADPSMRVKAQPVAVPLAGLGHAQRRICGDDVATFRRTDCRGRRRLTHTGRACLPRCARATAARGERDALVAFTRTHGLANLCRLLFNLNEFTFVD